MLAYTISRMLVQQAVLERDMGAEDRYGASAGEDWQPLTTVPCKAWWQRQTTRGPAREDTTISETVGVAMGGMLIPGGTDVTTSDRVAQVLDARGAVLFDGPFNIFAVLPYTASPKLIELAFREPN